LQQFFFQTKNIFLMVDGQTKKNQITSTARQSIRQHLLLARAVISNIETYNHANLPAALPMTRARRKWMRKPRTNASHKTSAALPTDRALQHRQDRPPKENFSRYDKEKSKENRATTNALEALPENR